MSRLASTSERPTCDTGDLCARTRYTTPRPRMNFCGWEQSLGMWRWAGSICGRRIQKMEDVQCSAIPTRPSQHMPPLHDWILRRLCTHRHFTHRYTVTLRYKLFDKHVNCTGQPLEKSAKISNAIRIQHLARNSRSASQSYTTRMLSACFWTLTKNTIHVLTFLQYQVFQDLQGPASSFRVGSSVRTSTRPLSVSLLRLCLRYLTCIQRR
jgi:hypothetical protein